MAPEVDGAAADFAPNRPLTPGEPMDADELLLQERKVALARWADRYTARIDRDLKVA